MNARAALVWGATGLVGEALVRRLLAEDAWGRVTAAGRRPPDIRHEKLSFQPVDFDKESSFGLVPAAEDVFCCLGTTIKKAGSPEAFQRVDHLYPLLAAKRAAASSCRSFSLVTAVGADSRSGFLYNRVKGEIEGAVSRLGIRSFRIFRPSLLLGKRREYRRAERLAEPFAKALSVFLVGPFRKYRAIEAGAVAAAMVWAAKEDAPCDRTYESDQMQFLADQEPLYKAT